MRRLLALLFGDGRRSDVVVECRRCGKTLARSFDRCPECGSGSIATYEIG